MSSIASSKKDAGFPPFSRTLVAGSAAHVLETLLLGHFLDRIKVQQEASPHLQSVRETARSIWQKEGLQGFKRGLRWNLLLSASKGACGWAIHNMCTRQVTHYDPQLDPSLPSLRFTLLVGGITALIESTLLICPLERLKTVEMTSLLLKRKVEWGSSFFEKVQFLYRGWSWTLLRQGCSWISYLGAYQEIRRRLFEYNAFAPLSITQKALLGIGTGSIAACLNAPFDLMKTQIQRWHPSEQGKPSSSMKNIVQRYGWRGMYNALTVKLVRNSWSALAITLTFDYLDAFPQTMRI